jgi:hypothetical protein
MDKISITFDLASSDYTVPLAFELQLDNTTIFALDQVTEPVAVSVEIDDTEDKHEFKFVMKNKTQEHTVVDDAGNIVSDAMLSIANFAMDDIQLGHVFTELAVYHHDFNGSQDPVEDKFYGNMGCNGHVSLEFTTPTYLWLLENM